MANKNRPQAFNQLVYRTTQAMYADNRHHFAAGMAFLETPAVEAALRRHVVLRTRHPFMLRNLSGTSWLSLAFAVPAQLCLVFAIILFAFCAGYFGVIFGSILIGAAVVLRAAAAQIGDSSVRESMDLYRGMILEEAAEKVGSDMLLVTAFISEYQRNNA